MDFSLNEEQIKLQDIARQFARNELSVLAQELEASGDALPDTMLKKYGEQGFLGINIDPRYGGMGLGNLEALLVVEEFARLSGAVAFPVFESCAGPVKAIERFGAESLKERVIPAVCAGDLIIAISMSESEAGSALTDLRTSGKIGGNEVVLNGAKRWCSGGGHAGGYLIYCRLSEAPGAKGIGAVYVPDGASGLSFGRPEQLMGFRGVPSSDLYLEDVRVPLDHIVVPAGGFARLMEAFDLERCGNATMSLGQASAALDDVLRYVQERKQFGRFLVEFQGVQLRLADMKMKVEAARLLIHRAAVNANNGHPSVVDSSLAKCYANTIAREVTGDAMQLMGAYGYSKEFPMERRLRDSWGWGIAGGAIDIQKVNIAAGMVGRRFDQRKN